MTNIYEVGGETVDVGIWSFRNIYQVSSTHQNMWMQLMSGLNGIPEDRWTIYNLDISSFDSTLITRKSRARKQLPGFSSRLRFMISKRADRMRGEE